jgi:hypothetical protein
MDQNNYDIYDDFGPNEFEELFEPPAVEDYSEYQGDDKEWYGNGPPDEEEPPDYGDMSGMDPSDYESGPYGFEWYYDDSGYYAYILIKGDAQDAQYISDKLQSTNIKSIKIGKSFRPASNGIQYDWYIRVYELSGNGSRTPSRETVNDFLIKNFGQPKRIEDILQYEIDELKKQLEHTRDEINLSRAQISKLQVENYLKEEELRKIIKDYESFKETAINGLRLIEAEKDSRLKQIQLLNDQISNLNKQNLAKNDLNEKIACLTSELSQEKDNYSRLIDKARNLENRFQDIQEKLNEAINRKENAEFEKQYLLEQLEDKESTIKSLEAKYRNYEKANGRKDEEGFATTLRALLRNIQLTKASISFIYNEIENPEGVLRFLEMLNNKPSEIRSERVESANAWREIHFNLGKNGNAGRFYYAKAQKDRKYIVIVSDKKLQKADIRRMKEGLLEYV